MVVTASGPAGGPLGPGESSLTSRLRLTILRMSRRLRQEAVGDVTASQQSALASIKHSHAPSLGELAAIERIAPPSMTRIVARLEEDGMVRRRPDEADRRVSRLELTEAGEALLEEIRSRRDAYLADRLRRLSDDELEVINQALPLFERLIADDRGSPAAGEGSGAEGR